MNDELRFPTELKLWKYKIERLAKRWGLDFDQTMYIIVNPQEMSELAARGGMPTTPHHWLYGQQSLQMKKRFRYGMGRLYEMVVNTKPNYAYLLQVNDIITQKSVMAHVCGHVDYFKNSAYYSKTNRDMVNAMAADAIRIERYCDLHGRDRVMEFYDLVLTFEDFVDQNAPYIKRDSPKKTEEEVQAEIEQRKNPKRIEPREPLPDYMDEYLNPPAWIKSEKTRLAKELSESLDIERGAVIPPEPTKDILLFMMRYATLEDWERDILDMIRRHALYYAPMGLTKLMNEGWAIIWEEEIMTEAGMLASSELCQYADELAGVTRQHRTINPYRLGSELWRDVWFRWDTGRHGDIWENCTYAEVKGRWDEFIAYKTITDGTGFGTDAFQSRWQEFSAFVQDLKAGRLAYPAEFFKRNLFTKKHLIPTWARYLDRELEFAKFSAMKEQMEPLDLQTSLLTTELKVAQPEISEEELRLKARRDVYDAAGKQELWLWAPDEVDRELVAIQTLRDFAQRFADGQTSVPPIPIPQEWEAWAKRCSEPVKLGTGLEKIFDVRATYDDFTFLEEFFTQEFCEEHKYFLYKSRPVYDWEKDEFRKRFVIDSRSFGRVKRRLIWQYANRNTPIIRVVQAGEGDLYLIHEHQGVDLDWWSKGSRYMQDVLRRLFWLWGGQQPVYLETIVSKKEETEPMWWRWHTTEEKGTAEDQEIDGQLVLFSYRLDEKGKGQFLIEELEDITFPAPF